MATNTSYLGLTKPAQSDLYNVDVFNDNADKVDANAQKTAANLATIEAVATASKPYVVGEYLVLNGILYKVTQAIANGGALVVGTNIAQDNVGTELKSIKDALSPLQTLSASFSGTTDANGNVQLNAAAVNVKWITPASTSPYVMVPFISSSNGRTFAHVSSFQNGVITNTAVSGTYHYSVG